VLLPYTGYQFSALVFLMTIVIAGTRWNRGPVLAMGVVSALVWNFIFIPPQFTLHIDKPQDIIMFAMFFVVALSMGHLITRLREREAALEQHHAEREQLLEAKHRAELLAESERLHRTLLDSVSHELKTPIAIIRTALDGLGQGNPYAAEIETANRRLQRIVENFLEMTRVESEALKPRPDWCEVIDVLDQARKPLERETRRAFAERQRHRRHAAGDARQPPARAGTRQCAAQCHAPCACGHSGRNHGHTGERHCWNSACAITAPVCLWAARIICSTNFTALPIHPQAAPGWASPSRAA
jgi:K+-sensing histidine kinase KdpD